MKERARILVIDDSTTLRKLVEIAFRGTTAEVDFASSGAEAVRRAAAHPPDVVLLDFMLPDMGGVDVCARFAESPATAAVPVVVMSAKRDGVREAFHAFPFVVDFVAKPFAMEEIRSRLGAAMLSRVPLGSTASPSTGSGAFTPPPPGSGVFTPPPVSGAFAVPASGSFAVPPSASSGWSVAPSSVVPGSSEVAFSGDLAAMPLLDALRFVASLKLTGCLILERSPRVEIYVRGGDVVLCAAQSPATSADLDHVDLARAPRAAIEQASEEQARTGKPVAAILAEAGYVRRELAPIAVRDQGARILAAALEARSGRATWRSLEALPDFVEAFGRPLAVTGIALEQRRGARANEDVPAAFLGAVYRRTPRFSRKLAGARLSSSERKLLALVDGEAPLSAIVERTGLSADKAVSVCNRLVAVDLIELREPAASGSFARIALWDAGPGDADFEQALRALLQRRVPSIELLELGREPDLAAAILRSRPRLILVTHPASAQPALLDIARSSASALVGVLDLASPAAVDGCLAAGFHAVLAKPIHLSDLERLLSS
jgi:CheY-like chemotaxis protein